MGPGEDGERAEGGPRTWVIVLGTVAAAAVVMGVIFGYRAWRDRDARDDVEAAPATTAPAETTAPGDVPAARLFTRTTDAGIEIRVDSMVAAGQGGGGFLGPMRDDAPPFCEIVDQVSAFAINAESVVQGGLPITKRAPPELAPMAMWGGPGSTLFGVLVQVDDDVVSAQLTVPGEGSDEMEPIGGVAALAIESELVADIENLGRFDEPGLRRVVVTVRYADGRVERASGNTLLGGPPVWIGAPECVGVFDGEGPVETIDPENNAFIVRLPPAGVEQPADPVGAQAQIEASFDLLYDPADPAVDVLSLVDDPFAMRETFEDARENPFWRELDFEDAVVTIEAIVFLSATEAAFDYELESPNMSFNELFGRAKLVDGTWRITRGTVCRDLRNAGIECPP